MNTNLLDICPSLNLDNYVMLPPEGPNQISNCGEKRPLDDSQRQSVLVQQKNGKKFLKFSINKVKIFNCDSKDFNTRMI